MYALAAQVAGPSMLQVVLMGLITVFVVLICLIVLIRILGAVMVAITGKKPAQAPAAPAAAPAPAAAAPAASGDKQKLVAAMAAAIAEDMGTDVDHIRIHSIRKL